MRYYKERRIWWANLVRQVMRLDFSWDAAPVDQYIRLYDEAVTSGGRWRTISIDGFQFFTEGIDQKSRLYSCWCTCNIVELAWLQSLPLRMMQFLHQGRPHIHALHLLHHPLQRIGILWRKSSRLCCYGIIGYKSVGFGGNMWFCTDSLLRRPNSWWYL